MKDHNKKSGNSRRSFLGKFAGTAALLAGAQVY